MSNGGSQDLLGTLNRNGVRERLGCMNDGIFKEGTHKKELCFMVRKTASLQIFNLLRGDRADGGTVVTGDVIFVTENDRHGFIDNAVA